MTKIVLLILAAVLVIWAMVKTIRERGLENIRGDVYQLFLKAERNFKHGENKAKFEYVITAAKELIPSPFNMFITESLLRSAVQAWFDLIKDLLDDGKLNNTGTELLEE